MAGLIATNTIAQGDSREVGLDQLTANGFSLPRAIPSTPWIGAAALEVAHVWLYNGVWAGSFTLNNVAVLGITAFLTPPSRTLGKPYRLKANENKSFQGSIVLGMGFVLEPEQAAALIAQNPKNRDCLFPYLNGEDLNSRPDQTPSRWVINFQNFPLNREAEGVWQTSDEEQRKLWLRTGRVPFDYPESVAADYSDLLAIIEEKVKPERTRKNENGEFALRYPLYEKWWIYGEKRPALYATITGMKRVIACTRVSKYMNFELSDSNKVFTLDLFIFAFNEFNIFCLLQSNIHESWVHSTSSTHETRLRYTATDSFETFPFPDTSASSPHGVKRNAGSHDTNNPAFRDASCGLQTLLDDIGARYYQHRQTIMQTRGEGLTKTYNRFHNPNETAADIEKLRRLHTEMDNAVAAAYGWQDLHLEHGFHDTKQGIRYTLSETARREVLDRLLELNHQRYAEEVEAGLHDKKAKKTAATARTRQKKQTAKSSDAAKQLQLF
jgi:hypothetical protein